MGPDPNALRRVRSMDPVTAIPRLYSPAVVPGMSKVFLSVGVAVSSKSEAWWSHAMLACACGGRVEGSVFLSWCPLTCVKETCNFWVDISWRHPYVMSKSFTVVAEG